MKTKFILVLGLSILLWQACTDKPLPSVSSPNGCSATEKRLENWPYQVTPYDVNASGVKPKGFPPMEIPADNPMTKQGIRLGRYLFYEKRLSANSTISCASCHLPELAFTDGRAGSLGLHGDITPRSSMGLINIGYASDAGDANNFMWDGKFATLEQQHLAPIENPIEMGANWSDVECVLRNDTLYQRLFRNAFGVTTNLEITRDLAAKAIAQFVRTLNSAGSKYDRVKVAPYNGFEEFTPSEDRGYSIFFNNTGAFGTINASLPDGECGHCHNTYQFTNNRFTNNGLTQVSSLNDFPDKGLGAITNITADNGRFRAPSLRNLGFTAPYMHDGRFTTLEQVMDHYVIAHTFTAPNLDVNIASPPTTNARTLRDLNAQEKADVIAFLNTLNDSTILNRLEWRSPF